VRHQAAERLLVISRTGGLPNNRLAPPERTWDPQLSV
jgi:hypothetical protein